MRTSTKLLHPFHPIKNDILNIIFLIVYFSFNHVFELISYSIQNLRLSLRLASWYGLAIFVTKYICMSKNHFIMLSLKEKYYMKEKHSLPEMAEVIL